MQEAGWEPLTSPAQYFTRTESAPLSVVYVTAPWCFRCRQVAGKVSGFPADYAGVHFFVVDLQDCEELGELLDIRTLPSFLLLRSGAEVSRLEGAPQQQPARRLAQAIREHLLGQGAAGEGPAGPGGAPAAGSAGS